MGDPKDPNNPEYRDAKYPSGRPKYSFVAGEWRALNDVDPGAPNNEPTSVTGQSVGTDWHGVPEDIAKWLGFMPTKIEDTAPGAHLDTTAIDQDSATLAPLAQQYNTASHTGDGGWGQALQEATRRTQQQAAALGQSQSGVGAQAAGRNIANAQAGASQRSMAQGEILRAQAKNDAATQQMGVLEANADFQGNQAATQAGVAQGVDQANQALSEQSKTNAGNAIGAAGQLFGRLFAMSDGGKVPGKPRVFGDDEANDTVPAMLSPGEIVIPRSAASSPEAAADFVRALQARKGVQHFDGGGEVHENVGGGTHGNGIGWGDINDTLNPFRVTQAPTVKNGGLLDTTAYDKARNDVLGAADYFAPQQYATAGTQLGNGQTVTPEEAAAWEAAGVPAGYVIDRANGRSGVGMPLSQYEQNAQAIANQKFQNSTEAGLAQALGPGRRGGGLTAAGELAATAANAQDTAGQVGADAQAATNQSRAAFADAVLKQRERDRQMAIAQQQAAWRRTQMNAGLTLANQATLRNIMSGVGQALSTGVSIAKKHSGDEDLWESKDAGNDKSVIDDAFDYGDAEGKAHGGVIGDDEKRRADAFVRALQRRG